MFIGQAVAALITDPDIRRESGHAVAAAELVWEYGFVDIGSVQPRSLREPEGD